MGSCSTKLESVIENDLKNIDVKSDIITAANTINKYINVYENVSGSTQDKIDEVIKEILINIASGNLGIVTPNVSPSGAGSGT